MINSPMRARAKARAQDTLYAMGLILIVGLALLLALLAGRPLEPEAVPATALLPAPPPVVEGVVRPEAASRTLDYIDAGEWTITAYCPCKKCCGKWAENRPNGIVYGAYGDELQPDYSCAAPLPHGTVVDIEGLGRYVVQDTTSDEVVGWYGGKIVDIYFQTHEEAVAFGKRTAKISIIR